MQGSSNDVQPGSAFSVLQSDLSELMTKNEKILKKKGKLEKLSSELQQLSAALSHSKAQRDMQIGRNYVKVQQKQDRELLQRKVFLEDTLIHIKQDYAKLCIKVQEQEDLVQINVQNCRLFDQQIQKLTSELESIKCISVPPGSNLPKPALNNSFSVNVPIQLNARRQGNRRSESFGGFK